MALPLEWKTFTRSGGPPSVPDIQNAVVAVVGGNIHLRDPRNTPNEIIVGSSDWTGVDLSAVQTALDALVEETDDERRRRAARREIEGNRAFKAVVLWIAQLHGKTPVEARDEIRTILQGL